MTPKQSHKEGDGKLDVNKTLSSLNADRTYPCRDLACAKKLESAISQGPLNVDVENLNRI